MVALAMAFGATLGVAPENNKGDIDDYLQNGYSGLL